MKDIELKLYEMLGVKYFRKFVLKIREVILSVLKRNIKFNQASYNNYTMKIGNGLEDLRDFKKELLFNASIHTIGLFLCIAGLIIFPNIVFILAGIINIYCVMLQRYNHIKINKVIKKYEQNENKKKKEIKDYIYETNDIYNYKMVNKKNVESSINFKDFLNKASLKQLIYIKKCLENENQCNNVEIGKQKKLIIYKK